MNSTWLRPAYDARLRAHVPDPVPDGVVVERDGRLLRIRGLDRGGVAGGYDAG